MEGQQTIMEIMNWTVEFDVVAVYTQPSPKVTDTVVKEAHVIQTSCPQWSNPADNSLQQESFNKYLWNWAEYSTLHFKQLYPKSWDESDSTCRSAFEIRLIIAKVYINNSWLLRTFTQKLPHLPLQNPVRWLRGHYRLTLMKKEPESQES